MFWDPDENVCHQPCPLGDCPPLPYFIVLRQDIPVKGVSLWLMFQSDH